MRKKLAALAQLVTDGRYRAFMFQRQVRDMARRRSRAAALAARLPRPNHPAPAVQSDIAALQRDGFVMLDGLASPQTVADMRAYFSERACSDPYRKELGSFVAPAGAPPQTHVAFFDAATVFGAPHALAIANDPRVLDVVAANLGAKPTISYMSAWWSMPTGGDAEQAEKFHRDVDDADFVKLFLYLTDVDHECGPHVFMRGSHVVDKLTAIRRYEDEEAHAAFGRENEIRFVGPAGTCFLEKTYGFHKGQPPKAKPRLIFQVLYSLQETPYGPKQPVGPAPQANYDPYINRVYVRS